MREKRSSKNLKPTFVGTKENNVHRKKAQDGEKPKGNFGVALEAALRQANSNL